MNKFSFLFASVAIILAGCGGGGGSTSSPSAAIKKDATVKDGIYVNNRDLVVMLVDTSLTKNGIVVGDYVNNDIYAADISTIKDDELTTKGLHYVSTSGIQNDPDLPLSIEFSRQGVSISGVVDGSNLMYSFTRSEPSLALSNIAGSHTNPDDGSQWIFNEDGAFTVNAASNIGCTISGKLERVKDYYYSAKNVEATQCADPALNGNNYEARVITARHDGNEYVLGVMVNDNNVLWGSAPISTP